MMKCRHLLAALALGAAACIAADGWRADIDAPTATGGVSVAHCRVGDIARLDYKLDQAGTLELVRAIGGAELSSVTITNAAGAGTVANLGYIGSGDFFRLSSATNAAAQIYVITK